jgi:hypothetical protein
MQRAGEGVLTLVVDVGEGEAPERWPETKKKRMAGGRRCRRWTLVQLLTPGGFVKKTMT